MQVSISEIDRKSEKKPWLMLAAVGSPSYEGFTKNKTADHEANKKSKLNEENSNVTLTK